MEQEPNFPIIQIFEGDKIIYGCANSKDFLKCDLDYLNQFQNSLVIDSNGTCFLIDYAEKIGWGTWLLGYHPLFKGRSIKVKFHYKNIRKISWTEFKEILINRLTKKVDPIWYANHPKKIIKYLDNSNNFKKVVELFSYEED